MQVIDLTHPLVNGQAPYPGASYPEFIWRSTYESKGRTSSVIKLSTHSGTHVDAPSHFIEQGKNIDEIPLAVFCGQARLIDVSRCMHEMRSIAESDFFSAAQNLKKAEIPVIYTGIDKYFGQPEFLSQMIVLRTISVQWLVKNGITLYGTDAYSVDLLDQGDFPNHKILLGAGIPIIEALNNLGTLPTDSFFLSACPLKLHGREASPCRAVAMLGL